MLSKLPFVYLFMTLFILSTAPPTDAFGSDLLQQLTDLLFGSDEDSSEESMETVINTKPNATLTVVCTSGCDLNVMCINCSTVNAVMMSPANGNGGGSGSAMATPPAPAMATVASDGMGAEAMAGDGMGMTTTTAATTTVDGG